MLHYGYDVFNRRVYRSDKTWANAHPDTGAMRPDDIAATIFALMGIGPETLMHDALNRPFAVSSGTPIKGIMA